MVLESKFSSLSNRPCEATEFCCAEARVVQLQPPQAHDHQASCVGSYRNQCEKLEVVKLIAVHLSLFVNFL